MKLYYYYLYIKVLNNDYDTNNDTNNDIDNDIDNDTYNVINSDNDSVLVLLV